MRPTISILVPFRPDGAWRDRVWSHLRERWAATGWEVITGTCPPGLWVKALAVADAASRASGDVLVIADADVFGDGIGEAVDAVLSGSPWAVPHTDVHRLTRQATQMVLDGGPVQGGLEQRPYKGVAGGGMVVLTRDAYATVPLDERFAGWGQEDQAWGLALTAVFGQPYRSTEPLWHLWHEPQDRLSRSTGSMSGRLLLRQYQAASGDRGRMLALLADRSTRENTMGGYRYRNERTGQEVELPTRNNRLDRLGNWSLVSKPAEEELADLLAKVEPTTPTPEPAPVAAPAPIEVDWPDVTPGRDFRPGVEPTEAPEVTTPVAVDPKRPAVNEPKARWLAYAKTRGVPDADTLTKTALIRACS